MTGLTVRELIELLKGENPDLLVRVEGCDCTGLAGGVTFEAGEVLIARVVEDWGDGS